jgi:carboxypeptidase family protein
MRKAHIALVLGTWILFGGCGPSPEAPGDECDPGGDACPAEAPVCAADPSGEFDDICQAPNGSPCDPTASDYCLGDDVCVSDGHGAGTCGIPAGQPCDPASDVVCAGNLACAELTDGNHACFPAVLVHGIVFDAEGGPSQPIAGAEVLALDDTGTAVSDIAVSGPDGSYEVDVAVAREADGTPIADVLFTLRASARDYQTFPGGVRPALPLSSSEALASDVGYVIDTPITDIALIPLPADQKGGAITGTVLAGEDSAGVLVVAENGNAGEGISAVSDGSGKYTIFNVPDGSYTVVGYAAGIQLATADVEMAGADVAGVDLALVEAALGTIDGNIQIVNGGAGMDTSVVLIPESTFHANADKTFIRGDVPRGLRAPASGPVSISGAFTIEGVPSGTYVVLAAFENDLLVRDPDPNIAGTQIVTVEMPTPGENVTISDSFKVTGALEVIGPGAGDEPEAVTQPLELSWVDDSSEDYYTVVVYDSFGEVVWQDDMVPSESGSDVVVAYDGPLEAGMYYQFRATSWRTPGGMPGPISTTEDLKGVFFVAAE